SNIGEAIGPVAAGAMLTWFLLSWREAALLNAIPALLMGVIFIFALLPKERQIEGRAGQSVSLQRYISSLWQLVQDKSVLGLSIMSGFRNMAQ
ncbi:MAG: MFS transporter, partial [Desulfuromonadales bacterium]|nr:MFS transporter [Desulfuromonadales bacterium]